MLNSTVFNSADYKARQKAKAILVAEMQAAQQKKELEQHRLICEKLGIPLFTPKS